MKIKKPEKVSKSEFRRNTLSLAMAYLMGMRGVLGMTGGGYSLVILVPVLTFLFAVLAYGTWFLYRQFAISRQWTKNPSGESGPETQ